MFVKEIDDGFAFLQVHEHIFIAAGAVDTFIFTGRGVTFFLNLTQHPGLQCLNDQLLQLCMFHTKAFSAFTELPNVGYYFV